MTKANRILWFLLRGLGIQEGQAPSVYKDIAFGTVFVPAAFVFLLNLHLRQFTRVFWGALAVALLILLIAQRRAVLVGGLFAVVGLRLLIGFVLTHDYLWLIGACACAAVVVATAKFEQAQRIDRSH
jgi:hypothetical protein